MRASISRIDCFKACRRMYFLKYVEGLIPLQTSEAIETGRNYHSRIEQLSKGEQPENDYSKEAAMAEAYKKFILPKIQIAEPEKWYEKQIGKHTLIGVVDGIATDGLIVEHKTTSADIESGEYEYNLQWDEQVLAYMSLTGKRQVHYTVCKKPTIRQSKSETMEQFYQRMVDWYDDNKIQLLEVYRTDDEVAAFEQDFVKMCDEMENAENFYKNTKHCNVWGRRCEYSGVCLHYDPNEEYVDFIKGEKYGNQKD